MKKALCLAFIIVLFQQVVWAQSLNQPLPFPLGARLLRQLDQTLRPLIYSGPFTDPRFDQVRLIIDGSSSGGPLNLAWSYGAYFQGHPETAIFQHYIANPLPVSVLATIPRSPRGVYRPTNVINSTPSIRAEGILLALSTIQYSSRYGGTLRLVFKAVDDSGVELFRGNEAWDIKDLTMSLYIAPNISWLSRRGISGSTTDLINCLSAVEFAWASALQYEIHIASSPLSSGNGPLEAAALTTTDLKNALMDLARAIRVRIADNVVPFATAFLNCVLKNDIYPGNIIDSMAISDNWIQVKTHRGQAYFTVYWRGGNITAPGYNPLEGEYDYQVAVMPRALFLGTEPSYFETLPAHTIELEGRDMSYGIPLATWKPSDCAAWIALNAPHALWGIQTQYTVVERTTGMNRQFDVSDSFWLYGDFNELIQNAAAHETYTSERQILQLELAADLLGGKMTTEYWIVLEYR